MKDDDSDIKKDIDIRKVGAFVTIPFVLAVPPCLGWWIGTYLDKMLDTRPYLMYLLIFVGIVAALREFLRIIKRFGNEV